LVQLVDQEGAESNTGLTKFEFGLSHRRQRDIHADKKLVCIDMKFYPADLTDFMDVMAIYDVECAGFFTPGICEVKDEGLRSRSGRNRWHDGGKTGAVRS
jgi:hypothetical protein